MPPDPSNSLRMVRRFDVLPEQVFDAWLDRGCAGKWLFATPTGKMVRVEIDGRVGGSFKLTDRREDQDVEHVGTYLEIERPRRLVFTFTVPKYSGKFTRVSIDIEPVAGGCQLTLGHEDVLPEYVEPCRQGWGKILSALAANIDASASYGVCEGAGTVRFRRVLPGGIESVWAYLTESTKRGLWLACGKMENRAGGSIELIFDHASLSSQTASPPDRYAGHQGPFIFHERVLRYEPPRVLGLTWVGGAGGPSEVTFELAPQGDKTLLQLTHRRLADRAALLECASGWHAHLGVLVDRLRGIEPRAFWEIFSETDGVYASRFAAETA